MLLIIDPLANTSASYDALLASPFYEQLAQAWNVNGAGVVLDETRCARASFVCAPEAHERLDGDHFALLCQEAPRESLGMERAELQSFNRIAGQRRARAAQQR
jgi:hypothetical protein